MIGITGGIASGKSVVSRRLRSLGAVVLDADLFAKEAVKPLSSGWAKVKEAFPQVIRSDNSIDRRELATIIFADKKKRRILEEIIHPEVFKRIQKEGQKWEMQKKIVFAEIPLLYEVGWEQWMDQVWVVYVDLQTQIERLTSRGRISPQEALQMISSQMPLEEKMKKATHVIDNTGSFEQTWAQVDALWKGIQCETSSDL